MMRHMHVTYSVFTGQNFGDVSERFRRAGTLEQEITVAGLFCASKQVSAGVENFSREVCRCTHC